ncbi:MAG: CapA family protein [Kofleriaceae bacterium]
MTRLRALAMVAVVACSGGDRSTSPRPAEPVVAVPVPDAAAAVVVEPAPAGSGSSAPAEPARAPRIELAFVGDVMFGGYFDNHYDPQVPEKHDPLVDVDALLASDLTVANLETTITRTLPNAGGPHDGKGHKRFVTLPERVAVITRHHIKTVTLANNHQLDNDTKGLTETPAILDELGIHYFGAARAELPVFRVETVDVKGWRVGFISASTQMNVTPRKTGPLVPFIREDGVRAALLPVIEAARANHDLVFVVIHWGYEYTDAPARWQIDAAHAFVDAGAAAVIGHHPHVWQGIERYKDAVIAYSLGNFVFPNGKERVRDTGVLRLAFAAPAKPCLDAVAVLPAIQVRQPVTHPVIPTPAQRADIAKRLFGLSAAKPLATTWTVDGDRFVTSAACPK